MSYRTSCNRCSYNRLKRERPDVIERPGMEENGKMITEEGVSIYSATGHFIVWYMHLSDRCAC